MLIGLKINIFDSLPALAPPKPAKMNDKLNSYLNANVEHVTNAIAWWHNHCHTYLCLSCMAFDYLTTPGMYISNLYTRIF